MTANGFRAVGKPFDPWEALNEHALGEMRVVPFERSYFFGCKYFLRSTTESRKDLAVRKITREIFLLKSNEISPCPRLTTYY